jgi:lipid-A-disaccharide synthase
VGLVAGEASGDTLGAHLIEAMHAIDPTIQFFGVAGPKMQRAGCDTWEPAESLAVMGLIEVLPHLPRLLRLRKRIEQRFIAAKPDVFVGIDAKEFNLGLSRRLRAAGLTTVQYVSPQVWAWRPGRVRKMHEAVDLVLCLLPFEKKFYDEQGLPAEFVGHPLADAVPLQVDRAAARRELGMAPGAQVVALLPGSRRAEVALLSPAFAATASDHARRQFEQVLRAQAPEVSVQLLDGSAQRALIACNVALVASGTATLEAALCKRPMVVVYRMGALTAWIIRRFHLVKSAFFAQPNLLSGRRIVNEYFQEAIDPERIATELLDWLDDAPRRLELERVFLEIHMQLKRQASERAAQAILALVNARRARAASA